MELSPYNPTPLRELKSGLKSHEFNARLQWAKPESEEGGLFGRGGGEEPRLLLSKLVASKIPHLGERRYQNSVRKGIS